MNLYSYTINSPTNYVDPYGLQSAIEQTMPIIIGIGIIVATLDYLKNISNGLANDFHVLLAKSSSKTKEVIAGLLSAAKDHANKCSQSDPEDPNQNHWEKEVKAFLDSGVFQRD